MVSMAFQPRHGTASNLPANRGGAPIPSLSAFLRQFADHLALQALSRALVYTRKILSCTTSVSLHELKVG